MLTFDPTDSPELRLEEPQSQSNRGGLSTTTGLELVRSGPARSLTMDERAVALATAVSADFGETDCIASKRTAVLLSQHVYT